MQFLYDFQQFIPTNSAEEPKYIINILAVVMLAIVPTFVQAACKASIPLTTPGSDFTVNGDGTVTQKKTGLMWKVCSQGQTWSAGSCSGTASGYTWQGALQIPQALNPGGGFAGYTDWRLPNIKELASIAELACTDPAINVAVFPSTPSDFYWSASPCAGYSNYAWGVDFHNGNDGNGYRSDTFRVRLVRGE